MNERKSPPLWFLIAKKEIGEKEIPGPGNNPRIVEYHGATKGGESPDAVPWCASFACWCLERAGVPSPRSKWARDFMRWGDGLYTPKKGCIVVFQRGQGGHVGFFFEEDEDGIFVLGGNQRDSVNISYFGYGNLLGYRWPAV